MASSWKIHKPKKKVRLRWKAFLLLLDTNPTPIFSKNNLKWMKTATCLPNPILHKQKFRVFLPAAMHKIMFTGRLLPQLEQVVWLPLKQKDFLLIRNNEIPEYI